MCQGRPWTELSGRSSVAQVARARDVLTVWVWRPPDPCASPSSRFRLRASNAREAVRSTRSDAPVRQRGGHRAEAVENARRRAHALWTTARHHCRAATRINWRARPQPHTHARTLLGIDLFSVGGSRTCASASASSGGDPDPTFWSLVRPSCRGRAARGGLLASVDGRVSSSPSSKARARPRCNQAFPRVNVPADRPWRSVGRGRVGASGGAWRPP
jgi:hypothetical protein